MTLKKYTHEDDKNKLNFNPILAHTNHLKMSTFST